MEQGSFTSLVFFISRGVGLAVEVVYKKLASMVVEVGCIWRKFSEKKGRMKFVTVCDRIRLYLSAIKEDCTHLQQRSEMTCC